MRSDSLRAIAGRSIASANAERRVVGWPVDKGRLSTKDRLKGTKDRLKRSGPLTRCERFSWTAGVITKAQSWPLQTDQRVHGPTGRYLNVIHEAATRRPGRRRNERPVRPRRRAMPRRARTGAPLAKTRTEHAQQQIGYAPRDRCAVTCAL